MRETDGTFISNPADLCHSFASFYSDLFTAGLTDPAVQESLLDNVSSSLPQDQAEQCDGLLTVEERYEALIGMAKRKAPGSDGLPMSSSGVCSALILWKFSTLVSNLVLCVSLSTEMLFPLSLRRVIV